MGISIRSPEVCSGYGYALFLSNIIHITSILVVNMTETKMLLAQRMEREGWLAA